MNFIFCSLLTFLITSWIGKADGELHRRNEAELRSSMTSFNYDNHRKSIQHLDPPMTSLARQKANQCRFKRCHVGQQCVLDGVTGRGACVCKRHCRKANKPICGTDGNFYMNRCEMHRAACLRRSGVFDAGHKDCFYKKTSCSEEEAADFRQKLFDFYQSTTSLHRTENNSSADAPVAAGKAVLSDVGLQATYDGIITNDARGESVKLLFRYLDLDGDGEVGSEELYELTLIEGLDSILPSPCSLFHLLHSADVDRDNAMNVRELLSLFNVTILHLSEDKIFVQHSGTYGDPITIRCEIQGEHAPVWQRKGTSLSSFGNNVMIEGAEVHFLKAYPSMAGNLSCHTRSHPEVRQTIELSINAKPRVQVYPKTQHVSPQSSVTLQCHAVGIPQPRVTWVAFDKFLDSERFIFMENNTELHINSATPADTAAYSCLATNSAGSSEETIAVIIDDVTEATLSSAGAFFIFQQSGVTIADPTLCQVLRSISAEETVPSLLRQDKLCRVPPGEELRVCKWSQAVAVEPKFVYASQLEESRLVSLDIELQRVVEVITTDPLPFSLHYVKSSDQLFVLCYVDWSRDSSRLLVVHAASVPGKHAAAQIQPLDGGNVVDFAIYNVFIPPEDVMNEESPKGFIARRGHQAVYKLNLDSLLYDNHIIDLSNAECYPTEFGFQPIGGVLGVTCKNGKHLQVDASCGRILSEIPGREFVSVVSRHVIQVSSNDVVVYQISASGRYDVLMNFEVNFSVDDVKFVPKLSIDERVVAFLSSNKQDILMRVDTRDGSTRIIEGIPPPTANRQALLERPFAQSTWYDQHFAISNGDQVDIINLNDNEITCRIRDVMQTSLIVWADGLI